MKRKPASPQPDLFENDESHVVPPPALKNSTGNAGRSHAARDRSGAGNRGGRR